MSKKVCIIGAGASGLACVKECKEAGFLPVCFEKSDYTGGLWRYHEPDTDAPSVAKSTIINSSKEMSAYSDFPPPKELPNYCHNTHLVKYFDSYAEKHNLLSFINLSHRVLRVTPASDYENTGKWIVRVKNLRTGEEKQDIYDAVFCCTGHHVKPLVPSFRGQEKFKGKIIHTHSYKTPQGFEGKNIVVVGIGNSGVDSVVELSGVANNCYLSTRRGAWIAHRVGPYGLPYDMTFTRRWLFFLLQMTPFSIANATLESVSNTRFDHKLYGLKPKHRIMQQHPTINDILPNKILSGAVVVKGDIQEFTENGIIFYGDDRETPIDVVVLATGYEVSFPFLDSSILTIKNNSVDLYKFMFNPRLSHPKTLVFIGLIQPVGALIPISEIQSRWAVHLLSGKGSLPPQKRMFKDIERKKREMKQRYYEGARHTLQVDWIPFMDEIASQFGTKPNISKYFLTDPILWHHLVFGSTVPYQYRLDGPGKWEGARDAIVTLMDRTEGALQHSRRDSHGNGVKANRFFDKITNSIGEVVSFTPYFLKYFKVLVLSLLVFCLGKWLVLSLLA